MHEWNWFDLIIYMQTIAANKKANHDFAIKEKFEAGLVLTGAEIKSLRVSSRIELKSSRF